MAEIFIDAPIEMYENHLKEAHKENVAKFFDNLVKKSGVNEQANIETVKKIRQKEAEIKAFDKKLGSKKKLRGFLIFLIVIGVIAAIVTGYLAYQSSTGVDGGGLPMWALILICVFSGLFAIGMLLLIILVVNKQIKNLDTNHIRSILKGLKPNNLKFNGHSKTEWIEAFKLEMQHRNQLADSFLANIFPEFNKKHKEAVKQVLQQQNNG